MVKDDEIQLFREMIASGESPIQVIERIGMPYKRGRYIIMKWVDRGWMEYGVSWRRAWWEDLSAAGEFFGLDTADTPATRKTTSLPTAIKLSTPATSGKAARENISAWLRSKERSWA